MTSKQTPPRKQKHPPAEPMIEMSLLDVDFDRLGVADDEFTRWRWPERERAE